MKLAAADSFRFGIPSKFCFNQGPRMSMYRNHFVNFDNKINFEINYIHHNKFFIKDFRLL